MDDETGEATAAATESSLTEDTTKTKIVCGKDEFQCVISHLCIHRSFLCDGAYDCGTVDDQSDEQNCGEILHEQDCTSDDQFQCTLTKKCIPFGWVCDGRNDCEENDVSDEENCPKTTQSILTTDSGLGLLIEWRPSPNFNDRNGTVPDMVIIHYTAGSSAESSLEWMQNRESGVSAHYLVGKDGAIYKLVDEENRAWHAGKSSWKNRTNINNYSIGIELDNNGSEDFTEPQMNALGHLIVDIGSRWDIPAENVLGHSDIAPGRKSDPGDKFDWALLRDNGVPNFHAP